MTFSAAPTMVSRPAEDPAVAAADLSDLKTIIYGGIPMYLADLEAALDVFGPGSSRGPTSRSASSMTTTNRSRPARSGKWWYGATWS